MKCAILQGTSEGDTLPTTKGGLSAVLQEQLPGGVSKLFSARGHADMRASLNMF